MEAEFDDYGAIARLAADLAKAGIAAGAKAHRITRHFGTLLQTKVKANASGRPGPRAPTGDYRRSIALTMGMARGGPEASVGTNRPQARRLEFGFKGTDAAGRSYNQPAYPHFGPAVDEIEPQYLAAIEAIAGDALDKEGLGVNTPTERQRDSRGRFM